MSSAGSTPPSVNKPARPLKRNSDDVGWEYGILIDPNDLNVIQCKLCPKIVKAGIYRLKLHIAGKKGDVRSCPNATEADKEKCRKAIEDSRRNKRARREKEQEVRDAVLIDDDSDAEPEETTGLDEIGGSGPRVMGPMDNFTKPLSSSSLSNGKKLAQPKISEHVMKERLHRFKRYVARWLYVRGVSFNAVNNVEFDQMIEAAGRFGPAKWWGNYGTQVPALQKMAIRILSLTSSASGCERNWSCYEGIHTKRRNKLTCERLEQLVFVRFNALHGQKKDKAEKNKKVDPLLATEATCAQGWIAEGAEDEEISDVDPVTGLTWQLIAETCGVDEVTKLRRSARLNQPREIEDDIYSEPEDDPLGEEEIEFESDQEDVVTTGYEEEEGAGTS
ncbi:hypothetical protein EJB05_03205, partial [Eragrostis curvula]